MVCGAFALPFNDESNSDEAVYTPPQPRKLTPEEMEWVVRQTNPEEMIAGLREVQETGGLELRDFIHELEEAAGLNE